MGITIDYEKGIKADDTATVRQSLVEAWESVFSDENATIKNIPKFSQCLNVGEIFKITKCAKI